MLDKLLELATSGPGNNSRHKMEN